MIELIVFLFIFTIIVLRVLNINDSQSTNGDEGIYDDQEQLDQINEYHDKHSN